MNDLEHANQLVDKAHVAMNQGKPAQAIKSFQQAKDLFNELDNPQRAAGMQHMIGVCHKISNDLSSAIKAFEQAIADYKKANDPIGLARVARDMGLTYIDHDRLSEAKESLEQSQQELQALPEGEMRDAELGITIAKLGQLYTMQAHLEKAEKYLIDGLALIRKVGHTHYELTALMHLASLYFKTKHYGRMLANAQAALGIIYEFDMYDAQTRHLVRIYALMARGYLENGSKTFSEHFSKKSLAMIQQLEPDAQELVRKDIKSEGL